MIYGSINASDSNHNFNPALKKVLDYIRQTDFSKFPLGVRTNLDGNNFYFTVFEYNTEPMSNRKAEVHQKYSDIHYILSGEEMVEVGAEKSGVSVLRPYTTEQDAEIYESIADEKTIALRKNGFVILFPGEVHRPGIILENNQPTTVRKVVFKVLASNLEELTMVSSILNV